MQYYILHCFKNTCLYVILKHILMIYISRTFYEIATSAFSIQMYFDGVISNKYIHLCAW